MAPAATRVNELEQRQRRRDLLRGVLHGHLLALAAAGAQLLESDGRHLITEARPAKELPPGVELAVAYGNEHHILGITCATPGTSLAA